MTRGTDNRTRRTFSFLKVLEFIPLAPQIVKFLYKVKTPALKLSCLGLDFKHPVGIAAGIDRKGEYFHLMDNYGPSFIEIGPLHDVAPAISNIQKNTPETLIFANLSNAEDLERSFSLIYDFVDAIVLNVSDNTRVAFVIDRLVTLRRYSDEYRPVLFRISPDISDANLKESVHYVLASGLDGIEVPASKVKVVKELSDGIVPVIACDEFKDMAQLQQALDDGASLVALKNSPTHYGPAYIKKVLKYLNRKDRQQQ